MTVWVNILSACPECGPEALPDLARRMPPIGVAVYSSVEGRFIGHSLRAEVRDGVDLWAELELTEHEPFQRAAAVLHKSPDKPVEIIAVMATNLSRDQIVRLTADDED